MNRQGTATPTPTLLDEINPFAMTPGQAWRKMGPLLPVSLITVWPHVETDPRRSPK